jgi:hypothetical protein
MKLFQINEQDLGKLEAALPRIMNAAGLALNRPDVQVLFEEVKDILSNVRWDYGPPSEVHHIPAGDSRDSG